MLLTKEEHLHLQTIQIKVLTRQEVSTAEKQWCLNLAARELIPVRTVLVQQAKKEGYNVGGVLTISC